MQNFYFQIIAQNFNSQLIFKIPILKFNFQNSNFQINFKTLVFFRIVLISLQFSNIFQFYNFSSFIRVLGHKKLKNSDFNKSVDILILACTCTNFLRFSNDFLFLLILNKYEGNFHNFKIMEFVRLINAKSIGLWWGPNI